MILDDILINFLESAIDNLADKIDGIEPYVFGSIPISVLGYVGINVYNKKNYYNVLNKKVPDKYNAKDMTKHCWISGVPGTGKSNKLRRIFVNTFVKQGWGGIYIDTHGTADEVLLSLPPERWKDVIYIAPWMKKVWGINIMQRHNPEDPGEIDAIAEDIVDVFSKMYPRSWGDKLANCIRFSVKAVLIAYKNKPEIFDGPPTLIDVYKMLKHEDYRNTIQEHVDNIIIEEFFIALKSTTAIEKLTNPLSSENVLVSLCQKEGFDILKAMNSKKIIICNLNTDKLSNNANLIAGLLISTIAKCAAKRKENNELASPYFAIAMDEFHEYANKHIASLISQMRKKNVCVLLANQYRDQTPNKEIQSAISMCQFKFIHTPAAADESWVCKIYEDFIPKEQIIKMPFYHCIQDIHEPGKERKPFITPVPMYKGDYDWEFVHKLKFASLNLAPNRHEIVATLNKEQNLIITTEDVSIGEIFYEGDDIT